MAKASISKYQFVINALPHESQIEIFSLPRFTSSVLKSIVKNNRMLVLLEPEVNH